MHTNPSFEVNFYLPAEALQIVKGSYCKFSLHLAKGNMFIIVQRQ